MMWWDISNGQKSILLTPHTTPTLNLCFFPKRDTKNLPCVLSIAGLIQCAAQKSVQWCRKGGGISVIPHFKQQPWTPAAAPRAATRLSLKPPPVRGFPPQKSSNTHLFKRSFKNPDKALETISILKLFSVMSLPCRQRTRPLIRPSLTRPSRAPGAGEGEQSMGHSNSAEVALATAVRSGGKWIEEETSSEHKFTFLSKKSGWQLFLVTGLHHISSMSGLSFLICSKSGW